MMEVGEVAGLPGLESGSPVRRDHPRMRLSRPAAKKWHWDGVIAWG